MKNAALSAYKAGVNARKSGKHHKKPFTISLAIVGGFVPLALFAYDGMVTKGPVNAASRIAMRLTGYDTTQEKFYWKELVKGWTPILAGIIGHKVANKLGINRMIAQAGIPILRI